MKLELTENQAKQFLAITESAHMDWEPFVVIRDQIHAALAPVQIKESPAAVAAFMDGVPHEQFDEEAAVVVEPEVISKKK
jgi:hypothetical protein